ncbi:MAG: PorV/PorQ family protein [Bacteroidota bacterium]|nr:PorV/PorQ family protein [Bacteroidota bacterium]
MKTIQKFFAVLFTFLMFPLQSNSQGEAAMYYLNFPRSVASIGLGEQGVVSRSSLDALTYNPANLIFAKNIQLSFFRNPFYMYGWNLPFTSINSSLHIPNLGYFGFEYLNWNLGKFMITSLEGPEIVKIIEVYERSISIGYANLFSEEFATGIQIRYAKDKFGTDTDKFLFSGGLNYNTNLFNRSLNFGFSLTNFSTAIEYRDKLSSGEEYINIEPPPSEIKLGLNFNALENDYHNIALQFQLTKPIVERVDNFRGQSAFKSLFTDWQDFPRDVTVHTGLSFDWNPLYLGGGFSFFQKFYLGNRSTGPKSYLTNYYTHAAIIGFAYQGVTISAGYGGWWHNVHSANYYFPQKLPRETFQFNVGVDQELIFNGIEKTSAAKKLEKIIIFAGPSYTFRLGRSKEENYNYWGMYWGIKYKNSLSYSIETDFYVDENNALISNFSYQSVPIDISIGYFSPPWTYESKIETFLFSSAYRYHPIETFQPLFIQGGLGIIRANPVIETYPKYDYRTFLTASMGALIELPANISLIPSVNFTTILSAVSGSAPRLGGYNQLDVSVKLGYQVK